MTCRHDLWATTRGRYRRAQFLWLPGRICYIGRICAGICPRVALMVTALDDIPAPAADRDA